MQEIRISVGIPAYVKTQQDVKFLMQCLESIQKQTIKPEEIIICDDGSPMEFIHEIGNIENLVYIKHEKNEGIGSSRNTIAQNMKGTHLAYCSSDDIWSLDKLKLQSEIAEKYPDDIIYTDYYNGNESGQVISEFKAPYHENAQQFKLEVLAWMERGDMFINFSSVIIPRRCLEILPIDKTLRGSEDLLWVCCAVKNFNFRHIPISTVVYRRHANMTTNLRGSEDLLQNAKNISTRVREFWSKN